MEPNCLDWRSATGRSPAVLTLWKWDRQPQFYASSIAWSLSVSEVVRNEKKRWLPTNEFDQADHNNERRQTHEHQSAGCHRCVLMEEDRDGYGRTLCYHLHRLDSSAVILYGPVLHHPPTSSAPARTAASPSARSLEMLLIVANVGTAVVLFPILKRQNEGLALGYVTARVIESTFIAIGIVSLLAVVTLRKDVGGAGRTPGSLVPVGRSLVAIHDWTFLPGPGWVVGVGNGLILGYLMYRSGLVPRGMAMLGADRRSADHRLGDRRACSASSRQAPAPQIIATAPEFVWELSLGIYLMVKGFKRSAIASLNARAETNELSRAA